MKQKIGVLMGGKSVESEVSLNSGRTVCDHLDVHRYVVVPLFQKRSGELFILPERFLHRGKIADFEHRLAQEAEMITWDQLKKYVDCVYIAMHGRYAEDGTLQGLLEVLGIPYIGSKVCASALGMDKIMQKKFLHVADIATPAYCSVSVADVRALEIGSLVREAFVQRLETVRISFPLIVKPCKEGSSFGVFCVREPHELYDAVMKAAYITPGVVQEVLIEEKIEGMEFSCIVLTDYTTGEYMPLPVTEIVPESDVYEYDQKYMPGRAQKITPARCTVEQQKRIQQTAVQVMQALGFTNIGRIDGFLKTDGTVIIIDPNSFSGMGPSSFTFVQAAQLNMSHTHVINHLIETELHDQAAEDLFVQKGHLVAQPKKLRVGVLLGGDSAEREISLESGRNITYKLSPHRYEAIPIFVCADMSLHRLNQKLLVLNSTHEIELLLDQAQPIAWHDLPTIVDFVFIGLHGGKGENGAVQGALEMLGLPYNGSSVLASALCMDKYKANNFLRVAGFDVPLGLLVDYAGVVSKPATCEQLFGHKARYPLIVKPHNDGCSTLVYKVETDVQLQRALDAIFSSGRQQALVEECIVGTELTVGVIGNDTVRALPPSQVVARAGILSIEEKFLPGAGENQTPALLPEQAIALVQNRMERVYIELQCKGYARIDCFYQTAEESSTGKERVVIIEINTLPGMTPATCIFHQAAELGIKPMDFIDLIVEYGLEEHGARRSGTRDDRMMLAANELPSQTRVDI